MQLYTLNETIEFNGRMQRTASEFRGYLDAARNQRIMATLTGVKRPPKAGEWYLSGAIPAAYRARSDCSTSHQLARLVLVTEINYSQVTTE